jgi:hypothetical protein
LDGISATLGERRPIMLKELDALWHQLEDQRQRMLAMVENLTIEQLQFTPGPDRWSVLQVLQHVVMGEAGMRQSEAELRDNPLREKLRPGKMVGIVKEFLLKDLVDAVPDPSMEPDGKRPLKSCAASGKKSAGLWPYCWIRLKRRTAPV